MQLAAERAPYVLAGITTCAEVIIADAGLDSAIGADTDIADEGQCKGISAGCADPARAEGG